MQVHLVCAALEWLAKGIVEDPARANRGTLVDAIHLRYRGWDAATLEREWAKTKNGVGLAWCAEVMWVIVDDVCRKIGVPNCLPGWRDALGRARDTLEKSRGKLPILSWTDATSKRGVKIERASGAVWIGRNGVPEIGQLFYRTSQPARQGSDATGHMGIVIAVNAADGSFETAEGNQGTSNRFARYRYTTADLQRYGFAFIHVAECAAVRDTPTGVLTPSAECFAAAGGVIRKQGAIGTVVQGGTTTTNLTTTNTTAGASSGGAQTAEGTRDCSISSVLGTSFAALTPEAKQRACTDVRLRDLDMSLLFHPSELKRKDANGRRIIAADILGATYGITAATHEFFGMRNGAAINRRNTRRDGRDEHTGLGIFKLRSGRLVYITAEGSLQWHNLQQNQLFGAGYGEGREPWRLHIERVQGDGFAEYMAEVFAGESTLNGPSGTYPRLAWVGQNGRPVVVKGVNGGGVITNLFDAPISYRTLSDILDAIERADKAGESRDLSPVVISYNMQPVPWTKSLEQVIQVATTVVSVALPVAGTFASASVLSTLRSVQDGLSKLMKAVSGLQGGDVVTLALDLGAAFLPSEYRQYVAPAKSAYRAAVGKNPTEALRALALFTKTELGIEATRWGEQLLSSVAIDVGSIAKAAARPFDEVRRQLATYQVGHMIGTVAELTAGDVDFARKLLRVSGQRLSDVGYLSTFVTALAGGQHPATIPNLGGLSRMLAMTGELASTIEGKSEGARSDVFAVLSLLGQGYSAPCAAFRDLAYQSFRQQAEKLRANGVKTMAVPALVGAEDAECFAYRVRADVPGLEVLYAEPKGGTVNTGTTVNAGTVNSGTVNAGTVRLNSGTTGISTARDTSTNVTPSTDVRTRIDTIGTDTARGGLTRTDTVRTDFGTITTVDKNDTNTRIDTGGGGDTSTRVDTGVRTDRTDSGGSENRTDWNTTVRPVECPPGYTLVGNECVPPPPVVRRQECPPGYVLVGSECVPPPPVVREQECPPGYVRSGNECIPPPPRVREQECPPGYIRNGNECIPPPPVVREPECPPGYVRNGNECVPPSPRIQPPTCPPGYRLEAKGDGFECIPIVTYKNDWTPQVPAPPSGTPPNGTPPSGAPGWPPFVFTMPVAPASGCGCCD